MSRRAARAAVPRPTRRAAARGSAHVAAAQACLGGGGAGAVEAGWWRLGGGGWVVEAAAYYSPPWLVPSASRSNAVACLGGAAPGGQGSALWRQQHGLPHAGGAEPGLGGDLERLVRVGVERRGHLREGALHVGVAEVHLIDDGQDGEVLLEGEPEVGHRLRLGEREKDRVWRVGAVRPTSTT